MVNAAKTISMSEFDELYRSDGGLCVECGEEAYGVEPDARELICRACGALGVYGAEQLLIEGLLRFEDA